MKKNEVTVEFDQAPARHTDVAELEVITSTCSKIVKSNIAQYKRKNLSEIKVFISSSDSPIRYTLCYQPIYRFCSPVDFQSSSHKYEKLYTQEEIDKKLRKKQ